MFFNYNTFQFYIKPGYIDMRKGIPGLTLFIQEMMNLNPFAENTMFLFCGMNKRTLKAIVWDKNGFWLMQKRLQVGTFVWPQSNEDVMKLTKNDVVRLLSGQDIFRKLPDLGNDFII